MNCLNLILMAILIIITCWYAFSTHKMLVEMKRQSITMIKSIQVLALTALMNAAGHPAGEQPIPKLRTILKELDIDLSELEEYNNKQKK